MKSFYTFSPFWKDQLCQMCFCPSKLSLLLSPSTISLAGCTLFTFCHFSVFKPLYTTLPSLTYFSLCARKNTQLKKRIQLSLQLKATEFLRLEGISRGFPAQARSPRAGCPGLCLVGFLGISEGRDTITTLGNLCQCLSIPQ